MARPDLAIKLQDMNEKSPSDFRRHRTVTDRNLLIGFFVVLVLIGGALIFWAYGGLAGLEALICMFGFALMAVVVWLVMTGLGRLSEWLDNRD